MKLTVTVIKRIVVEVPDDLSDDELSEAARQAYLNLDMTDYDDTVVITDSQGGVVYED